MKKQILGNVDLTNYMEEHYVEYASETLREKRLRFMINLYGCFRVTHGKEVLYSGPERYLALKAYNDA